jgi:hypothetical protein
MGYQTTAAWDDDIRRNRIAVQPCSDAIGFVPLFQCARRYRRPMFQVSQAALKQVKTLAAGRAPSAWANQPA